MRDKEKFYIKRIKTLMRFHSKMILDDKELTIKEKQQQLQIVEKILNTLPKEREVEENER